VTLIWSTPAVGDEFNQAEGTSTMNNRALDQFEERKEFEQYFDRLLAEVEAPRPETF
jgi:hypothetical protein